jgi:O-antigen/teichoic acid export membrane protein
MKTVRLSLLFLGGLGLLFGLAIFLGAPLLVHLVLGHAFADSVPVLRVFALWIPLIAVCTVIIFQLLLPNHLDNQFNLVNITAGVIGIGVAFLLAPKFGAVGIAWSAVFAQLCTLIAFTPLTPALAPRSATQQMKLRLWETLAEADAEAIDPIPVALAIRDRATPQVVAQNPR